MIIRIIRIILKILRARVYNCGRVSRLGGMGGTRRKKGEDSRWSCYC